MELAPLCAPQLGWPGAQIRGLSLQVSGLPAGPPLKTRHSFPETRDPASWAHGPLPKQTGKPMVGQAVPLSLFGERVRPSGSVTFSAAEVGGGCRPRRGRGEMQFPGLHGSRVPALRDTIQMAFLGQF